MDSYSTQQSSGVRFRFFAIRPKRFDFRMHNVAAQDVTWFQLQCIIELCESRVYHLETMNLTIPFLFPFHIFTFRMNV
jgi:hypothetical protein